jgi:hypothetical protein
MEPGLGRCDPGFHRWNDVMPEKGCAEFDQFDDPTINSFGDPAVINDRPPIQQRLVLYHDHC